MVQLDESNIEIQWHCPPCDLANPTNGKSAVQRNNIEKQKELSTPVKVTKETGKIGSDTFFLIKCDPKLWKRKTIFSSFFVRFMEIVSLDNEVIK